MNLNYRPRRLRSNAILRNMLAETKLSANQFVQPYFVSKSLKKRESISSMPGIYRHSMNSLLKQTEKDLKLGLNRMLLFGTGDEKRRDGSFAADMKATIPSVVRKLKANFGSDLFLITDVCLCAYTLDGHCGISGATDVINDASLEHLGNMALAHAEAGADLVSPSDMMDGRVGYIRNQLDEASFSSVGIMSYSVKYASAYYGPFREAASSSPGKGNRSSYQMDFRNTNAALREIALDEAEGADIVMVKPALAYLDIVQLVKQHTTLPVACYNVSGEYAMVKMAAAQKLIVEKDLVLENMYAFARAGAQMIISYHSRDLLKNNWLA